MAAAGTADAARQEGLAHHRAGRLGEALQAYAQALEADPGDWNALHLMGVVAADVGDLERAARMIETAIAGWPADATYHNNLGNALRNADPPRAGRSFRRALALRPASAPVRTNLAAALAVPGRGGSDGAAARRLVAGSLALAPAQPDAWWVIGDLDQRAARLAPATTAFRRGLALDPGNARLWGNLGHALLQRLGRLDAALAAFAMALRADPGNARAASDRLFALGYRPGLPAADLRAAAEAWDRAHGVPRAALIPAPATPAAGAGKLRVGYVSADLGRHPVGFFLAGVLEHHDGVAAVVYSDRRAGDDLTRRLRAAAASWRDTADLSDAQLVGAVRADGIDILVDCAGHTGGNRLTAFAMRPAFVQVTGFGHGATTGLAAIDYLVTDRRQTPAGFEAGFTERLLVMPDGYVCWAPPADAPPVAPLPMERAARPVLGSFNTLTKHNDGVFDLWADVLRAVPAARLLLKGRLLDDPDNRAAAQAALAARGVDPARLVIEGGADNRGMLAAYGRVDVALDPFPYGGGLTTLEALWMGVPVVTLGGGERFTARHAEAHLGNAGLGDLIARDAADYVAIVRDLIADPAALARRRAGLRARVTASPICDAARYTRALEAGYRRIRDAACRGETLPKRVEIGPA